MYMYISNPQYFDLLIIFFCIFQSQNLQHFFVVLATVYIYMFIKMCGTYSFFNYIIFRNIKTLILTV